MFACLSVAIYEELCPYVAGSDILRQATTLLVSVGP
jgi:hypothetical protein